MLNVWAILNIIQVYLLLLHVYKLNIFCEMSLVIIILIFIYISEKVPVRVDDMRIHQNQYVLDIMNLKLTY